MSDTQSSRELASLMIGGWIAQAIYAATILRNCRRAMNPQGRVLVVETVIPPLNQPCFGKWLDLMMLIVDGRERTADQYRQLFSRAGLKLNRIIPTAHEISIIEGVHAE